MIESLHIPLCIDGRMLNQAGTGVSTYARLLHRVQANLTETPWVLDQSQSRTPPFWGALSPFPRVTRMAPKRTSTAPRMTFPDLFRRAHIHFGFFGKLLAVKPTEAFGIMHWTYPVPLYMKNWINIYAIHDAIPLVAPHLTSISSNRLKRTFNAIADVADCITTISEASRHDLINLDIFSPDRIINSSLAIGTPPAATSWSMRGTHGLEWKNYLLFCGSVEPRKNLTRLLAAYRLSGTTIPLAITGPSTQDGSEIERDIAATPGAIRLPYQSSEALDDLIRGARALLFPSLAEGFGLPVVEAMARGTAVVSSNIPAIAEVAGDAALLVEPTSVEQLSDALKRVSTDEALVQRLSRDGLERARLFSEDGFRDRIAAIYKHALTVYHADRKHRGS